MSLYKVKGFAIELFHLLVNGRMGGMIENHDFRVMDAIL